MTIDPGRRTDAAIGSSAGFGASILLALLLVGQGSLALDDPFRFSVGSVGWLLWLALGAGGGAIYGALSGYRPGRLAAAVGGGLLFGLLWWALVWLTVVPAVVGPGPSWSVAEASAALPRLISSVLFGGLAAVAFHALGTGLVGERAAAPWRAADRVPISTRIVIVGGGFGGVATAQRLEQLLAHRPEVNVTLVSDTNFLLFTPMLAEVASSSLSARHVAAPLRAACPRTSVRHGHVEGIDVATRSVRLRDQGDGPVETLPYDELVLAVGAVPTFHGLPGVAARAFTLKSLADATDIRDHVIRMLDRAEPTLEAEARRRMLTFVVAGGGFAGAELVAELHDLVAGILRYYPRIDPGEPRFVLVHSRDRILPELGEDLGAYALERLSRRGIEFILGVRVRAADHDGVALSDGSTIAADTFVWTAGNEPAPLAGLLAGQAGEGPLTTDDTLRVVGLDHVWAVGDCARIPDAERAGEPCPPTAQHALRQGHRAADNVVAAIDGRPTRPFAFRTLGMLVVLGHNTAAAEIRGWRFSGLLAWFMWRGIYVAKLPGFEKRLRVLVDWVLDLLFPRDIVVVRTSGARGDRAAEPSAVTGGRS